MIPEFITGRLDAVDDPLWQKSDAESSQEYAFWAPRMCGVACLRMALDYWRHPVPPDVGLGLAQPARFPDLPAARLREIVGSGQLALVSVHKSGNLVRLPSVRIHVRHVVS
ncbi:hypothetical protein ACFC00_36695 [Streptomyces adustus]|uniref:hypothetical protein n=1 Tax=Streptomyces adustus TaxID=1609272 RepID=UPI0035DA0E65